MEINLKLTILLLLPAAFILLLAACGDSQTADTPTPEAKVAAKAIAQPTNELPKPEPTKLPTPEPTPTEAPPTATAATQATGVAPTPAEVVPSATLTPLPTATPTPEAKVVAKVDVEPSPTKEPPKPDPTKPPIPTKEAALATPATPISTATTIPVELAAICSFDPSVPQISCRASGTTQDSQLRWESNISGWATGASYDFKLVEPHQLVPQVIVTLQECQGPSCQTVEVLLDTSSIVPESEGKDSAVSSIQEPEDPGHPGLVGCVDKDSITFTHHATDIGSISGVYPNIVTSGNWLKPNNYVWIDQDAPVYAPTNATNIGLLRSTMSWLSESGSPVNRLQFAVELQISCTIRVTFGHLEELVEPFASLAPTEAPANDLEDVLQTRLENFVYLPMEVKAGTLLGYGRHLNQVGVADGFDFVMYNGEKSNHFANQERYEALGDLENLLHADCPFDYYSPSMRAEWVAKFGYYEFSVDEYDCDMAPDVVGAIAGGWFQSPYSPATVGWVKGVDGEDLFVPVDWGLAIRIKSDGFLNIGHPGGTLEIDSTDPSFRDPKTVFDASCFFDSSSNQFGYLKPIGDMEMTAAFGSGPCPSEMPSDSQTFYR